MYPEERVLVSLGSMLWVGVCCLVLRDVDMLVRSRGMSEIVLEVCCHVLRDVHVLTQSRGMSEIDGVLDGGECTVL